MPPPRNHLSSIHPCYEIHCSPESPQEAGLEHPFFPRHLGRPKKEEDHAAEKQSTPASTLLPTPPWPEEEPWPPHQQPASNSRTLEKDLLYRRRRQLTPGTSSPPHHPQHPHAMARRSHVEAKKGSRDKNPQASRHLRHGDQPWKTKPLQIRRSGREPRQKIANAALQSSAGVENDLQHHYSNAPPWPPPHQRRRAKLPDRKSVV